MTQHPITPPPELVEEWFNNSPIDRGLTLATQAAQWGADQELEACVNYIDNNMSGNKAREFRAIRRPKPPSSKQQALEALDRILRHPSTELGDAVIIRHALEALPE